MRDFLTLHDDLEIVGEAADGAGAIEQAASLRPDVVVMDLVMPGVDGIDATVRIKAANPDVEIVAITSFVEEARIVAALEAGASGFLLRTPRRTSWPRRSGLRRRVKCTSIRSSRGSSRDACATRPAARQETGIPTRSAA